MSFIIALLLGNFLETQPTVDWTTHSRFSQIDKHWHIVDFVFQFGRVVCETHSFVTCTYLSVYLGVYFFNIFGITVI